MKKLLCLLLFAGFILGIMSCSSGETVPEHFDTGFIDSNATPDFNGAVFVFKMADAYMENFVPEISTAENDAKLKKISDTEKKLNCTINFIGDDWSYESNVLAEYAANGHTGADFTYSRPVQLYSLISANLITDLASLDNLDITDHEKWGTEERLQMLTRGKAIYGIQACGSMYWPQMPIFDGALLSNNEKLSRTGGTLPGELIENGKWTQEYFLDHFEDYGDGNGYYSLCVLSDGRPYLELSAIYSNGASVAYRDENGKYNYGLTGQPAMHALEFARDVRAKKNYITYIEATSDVFTHGNGSFMLTSSWRGTSTVNDYEIMNNLDDVSWWPFPYGPDAQYGEGYGSHFSSGLPLTALYSNGRDEDAAYVFNELYSPLEEYGTFGYYDFLKRNYFHHDESFDVYYNALLQSRYIFDIQLDAAYSSLAGAMEQAGSGKKTVSEALETVSDLIQNKIAELNANNG